MTVNIVEYASDVYGLSFSDFHAKHRGYPAEYGPLLNWDWLDVLGPALGAYWQCRQQFPQTQITITIGPP